jgi:hypothetical protein
LRILWRLFPAVVFIAGIWWVVTLDDSGTKAQSSSTQRSSSQATPNLTPVIQYPGILYNRTGRAGVAPLNLVTREGADYYVKLVDITNGKDAVGIYVFGGQGFEVLVPLGSYEMRYASGKTWYGLANLFGPGTRYAKAHDIFNFRATPTGYAGYTVELILQSKGNLRTTSIRPEQF